MYTKAERRKLRRLAGSAYARELAQELTRLGQQFSAWERGELDPFQLSEAIHEFHQGPSRALYNYYTQIEPYLAVARAVVEALLPEDELPAGLRPKLAAAMELYRTEAAEKRAAEKASQEVD